MVVWVSTFGILGRCSRTSKEQNTAQQSSHCIARVGDAYLYSSDLVPLGMTLEDMDRRKVQYMVEEWAYKQLLMEEDKRASVLVSSELKKQVNMYQTDLFAHHFLERSLQRLWNNHVSSEEIADYYEKHKQNDFVLPYAIVKGLFVVVPKRAAAVNTIKSLMLSTRVGDRQKLKNHCKTYARMAMLEDDQWMTWEAVLAKVGYCPPGDNDIIRLLKTNKFIHVTDRNYVYLLKINHYKLAKDIAPLTIVTKHIQAVILYKRKLELINKIKNDLLEKAKKEHRYICYVH